MDLKKELPLPLDPIGAKLRLFEDCKFPMRITCLAASGFEAPIQAPNQANVACSNVVAAGCGDGQIRLWIAHQLDQASPHLTIDLEEIVEGYDISIHAIALHASQLLVSTALGELIFILLNPGAESIERHPNKTFTRTIPCGHDGVYMAVEPYISNDRVYVVINERVICQVTQDTGVVGPPWEINGTVVRSQILDDGTFLSVYVADDDKFCVCTTDGMTFHELGDLSEVLRKSGLHEALEENDIKKALESNRAVPDEELQILAGDRGKLFPILKCTDITPRGKFVLLVKWMFGKFLVVINENGKLEAYSHVWTVASEYFSARLSPYNNLLSAGVDVLTLEVGEQEIRWELVDQYGSFLDPDVGMLPFHSITASDNGDFLFCWRNITDNAHAVVSLRPERADAIPHVNPTILKYYPKRPGELRPELKPWRPTQTSEELIRTRSATAEEWEMLI